MDVREKMIAWRKKRNLPLDVMSKNCGVSVEILNLVEQGGITHPKLVNKIRKVYKLTEREAEELMPENYRKSSSKYDPDLYKVNEVPFAKSLPPLQSELVGVYIREHKDRQEAERGRRRA